MIHPNFTILYVEDPLSSGRFYTDLLGIEPIEASPTFVLFMLSNGLMLGLWSKHTVQPESGAGTFSGEIAFRYTSFEEIDKVHEDWIARGISISFRPQTLEFGRSFVALDPDGHRLRVFSPSGD
ncbi:catechol 2,3-dioxygenase-like lactoylglutathione lyase family enzyme [Ochrobactrum daejeonense]|uniref:Catechol 2,3-dioxygenase-like lactoylglutathione lyase family enzyme n=1 Tax=Brucella daejeonensis TaxID=659015 RepID=A0A7W9AZI1_9HYPH|nr:VOC family protein [Brucella daejeonensis]MBB5703487.1 catechol 2,3-dioxygenase-like lactoylglutathione lyase family enzyme [Brucella daejeonensis]NKB78948.1 drug:proton antiporter [Brucella daejeonensis]